MIYIDNNMKKYLETIENFLGINNDKQFTTDDWPY